MTDGPGTAHRRWNPLAQRWVLVTPGRLARPWQGQQEATTRTVVPSHDPACYMCPGNARANGTVNPPYSGPYVFDNDFPALRPYGSDPQDMATTPAQTSHRALLRADEVAGVCRVVCYTPRHDATLAHLSDPEIRAVVDCWADELIALRQRPSMAHVQIFENRGALMGASNPHPHGQIWATSFVPDEVGIESRAQAAYAEARGGNDLLGDYLAAELQEDTRVLIANGAWVCVIPFWATWPFETLIIPRRPLGSMEDATAEERDGLAQVLGRLTRRYDGLFDTPFPYSMGVHVRPAAEDPGWRMHVHFYPPLLRSASVRKFMVGFELFAMAQRDFTPEDAAGWLRGTGSASRKA